MVLYKSNDSNSDNIMTSPETLVFSFSPIATAVHRRQRFGNDP